MGSSTSSYEKAPYLGRKKSPDTVTHEKQYSPGVQNRAQLYAVKKTKSQLNQLYSGNYLNDTSGRRKSE